MTTNSVTRKGLIGSLAVVMIASASGAYGTFAYFNDTETSASNLFAAGTLDLSVSAAGSVDGFVGHANFAPGDAASGSLTLTNVGSISSYDGDGHTVSLDIDPTVVGVDADAVSTDMDAYLELTTLTYAGSDLLASIADSNANGRKDLADLGAATISGLADPGAAGEDLVLAVSFVSAAGNALQGDSVELTLAMTLSQS